MNPFSDIGSTVTCVEQVLGQLKALLTVTEMVNVVTALTLGGVQVIAAVPCPLAIVPPLTAQVMVPPDCCNALVVMVYPALWPAASVSGPAGAVQVARGFTTTDTVVVAVQPLLSVTVTV